MDLGQVGAEQGIEGRPSVKLWFVAALAVPGHGERGGGRWSRGVQLPQHRRDFRITLSHLGLIDIVQFQGLA